MGLKLLALAPAGRALSIRNKLLAMVLLPLVGVLPLLGGALLWWSSLALDGLLRTKVRSDLAVAHGYFDRVLGEVGASVGGVAGSQALTATLSANPSAPVDAAVDATLDPATPATAALLQSQALREQLDFLTLQPLPAGATTELPSTSVELLGPEQLALLAPGLQPRVAVPLLDTRNAAPTDRRVENRAMVLLAQRPVRDAEGRVRGRLMGGRLLNRNLSLIDHINEIVYPAGSLPLADWGSRGTATLFLDDVRISTNVRLFGGDKDERQNRAIGTRVSASVRAAVLGRGSTWLDRAFVVDDWYVSGYQPISNAAGQRVGMLYVGVLERPFTRLKYAALAAIGALFFGVMIVAAILSLRWARSIFGPLQQMQATMLRVEAGEQQARVGAVASRDEIGRLARHFDNLLDLIGEKTQALQRLNAELDAKVAERTQALHAAQQQVLHSERMATVGQLTASIAHEINNPIAVIQGNLDLVRETLGPHPAAARDVATELQLVDTQIERMRRISTQLLQLARPGDFAPVTERRADTAAVLDSAWALACHQASHAGVQLRRDFGARAQAAVDRHALQQVLVNLIVNALQALHNAATPAARLELRCRDSRDASGRALVLIEVEDNGPGIAPAVARRLFGPFVSDKAEGTGLGLWISRGIVQRSGGSLDAAPHPDRAGTVFSVRLPAADWPAAD